MTKPSIGVHCSNCGQTIEIELSAIHDRCADYITCQHCGHISDGAIDPREMIAGLTGLILNMLEDEK